MLLIISKGISVFSVPWDRHVCSTNLIAFMLCCVLKSTEIQTGISTLVLIGLNTIIMWIPVEGSAMKEGKPSLLRPTSWLCYVVVHASFSSRMITINVGYTAQMMSFGKSIPQQVSLYVEKITCFSISNIIKINSVSPSPYIQFDTVVTMH